VKDESVKFMLSPALPFQYEKNILSNNIKAKGA